MELGKNLGIDKNKFGKIYSFVDFGNVNYWYRKDIKNLEGNVMTGNEKLMVKITKLAKFIDSFSIHKKFYYGLDLRKRSTWHITNLAKQNSFVVIKKPIQWVKHHLGDAGRSGKEIKLGHKVKRDRNGHFIEIPKCNFDVELTIDAIKSMDYFDTFALFSGDSDFAVLLSFLRQKGKKIILFYDGRISHRIKDQADLLISAQKIKNLICTIKTIKTRAP